MPQDNRALRDQSMPRSVFLTPPDSAVGDLTTGVTEGVPLPRRTSRPVSPPRPAPRLPTAPEDPSRLTPPPTPGPFQAPEQDGSLERTEPYVAQPLYLQPAASEARAKPGMAEATDRAHARAEHIEAWTGSPLWGGEVHRYTGLACISFFAQPFALALDSLRKTNPVRQEARRQARAWCSSRGLRGDEARAEAEEYVSQALAGQDALIEEYRFAALQWHGVNLTLALMTCGLWALAWPWLNTHVMSVATWCVWDGRSLEIPEQHTPFLLFFARHFI